MTNIPRNPFDQPEPLESVFARTYNYAVTRDNARDAFKARYKPSPVSTNSNLFYSMFTKLTHLTTTAIAGLTTTFALFGGLTLTQVYAQEEYKPLTVMQSFFGNQQSDIEPTVALQPDDENYLVYVEPCGLGLKYPKEFSGYPTYLSGNQLNDGSEIGVVVYAHDKYFSIDCLDNPIPLFDEAPQISTESVNLEELKQASGWFASLRNLDNLRQETFQQGDRNYKSIKFEYNDKYYTITTNYEEVELADLSAIQLQFEDQIENVSTDVVYQENNSAQPGSCGAYEFNSDDYAAFPITVSDNFTRQSAVNITPLRSNLYNKVFITLNCALELDSTIENGMIEINTRQLTNLVANQKENQKAYVYKVPGQDSTYYTFKDTHNNWIIFTIFDENGSDVDVDTNDLPAIFK